jgi:hypothetical protein
MLVKAWLGEKPESIDDNILLQPYSKNNGGHTISLTTNSKHKQHACIKTSKPAAAAGVVTVASSLAIQGLSCQSSTHSNSTVLGLIVKSQHHESLLSSPPRQPQKGNATRKLN